MRQVMKFAAAMSVAAVALAACGSSSNSGGTSGGAATSGGTSAAGLKVGMAYDVGGRGDQSFNDAAAAGLDKAVKELGVQSKEAAATNGEAESARQERLQQLIDAGYNNVVAVGFAYAKSVGAGLEEMRRYWKLSSGAVVTWARVRPLSSEMNVVGFAARETTIHVEWWAYVTCRDGGCKVQMIQGFKTGPRGSADPGSKAAK